MSENVTADSLADTGAPTTGSAPVSQCQEGIEGEISPSIDEVLVYSSCPVNLSSVCASDLPHGAERRDGTSDGPMFDLRGLQIGQVYSVEYDPIDVELKDAKVRIAQNIRIHWPLADMYPLPTWALDGESYLDTHVSEVDQAVFNRVIRKWEGTSVRIVADPLPRPSSYSLDLKTVSLAKFLDRAKEDNNNVALDDIRTAISNSGGHFSRSEVPQPDVATTKYLPNILKSGNQLSAPPSLPDRIASLFDCFSRK